MLLFSPLYKFVSKIFDALYMLFAYMFAQVFYIGPQAHITVVLIELPYVLIDALKANALIFML